MRFFHTILTQFFDTKIFSSETLKYWIGVLWGQSYLMGRMSV